MPRLELENQNLFDIAVKESFLLQKGFPINSGRYLVINGEQYLDFSTASYLGLDCDREFMEFAISTIESCGLGRCSSPLYVAPDYYEVIKKNISKITQLPDVVLLSSTSLANMAAIRYGLSFDYAYVDKFCHRSIAEAIKMRRSSVHYYNHTDIEALRIAFKNKKSNSIPAIITDGVYSVSGITAPVSDLYNISQEYRGYLIIDDAHGFGIDGKYGEGTLRYLPRPPTNNVIYIGSLTKSLSGYGGFIACSQDIGKRIRKVSPQYGFSCSIPLIYSAINSYACQLIGSSKWINLVNRLKNNWLTLNNGIAKLGRSLMATYSPIAVLKLSDLYEMKRICIALRNEKVSFNVVGFPAVPIGDYRIRFCLSASHTIEDITKLLSVFKNSLA